MIQRIQTIHFTVALILVTIPFLGTSLVDFNAETIQANITVYANELVVRGESTILFSNSFWIVESVISLVLLLTIFSFKNRKRQVLFGWITFSLQLFTCAWMIATALYVQDEYDQLKTITLELGSSFYAFASSFLFIFFGIRGVRKDQSLVDSFNRLR